MTISLRPALAGDGEFLFSVYASTRMEEMDLLDWNPAQKEAFLRMQFHAQRQQYQFTYPDAIHQIIEFNGVPAGRLLVDRAENEILLVDIALLPDFRNLGLGASLLRSLQAEGNKIVLHVIRSNPAVNLYQRLGFIFVGEEAFYSKMEWSPTAVRNFPWPGLRVPMYRPASLGNWSLKKVKQVAQFGYFMDWQGQGDIDALYYAEQTWMSNARDEVDSQTPHIAAAFGHTVLMGAGMGIALCNLLPKPDVTRLTLIERDPLVIELLRQSTDLKTWPGIGKLRVEIRDALAYLPDLPVDHLYADIWATPGEPQSIPDMQRIQANVRAKQVGWWGQELLFLDWLAGETPTVENYSDWAGELGLPLIEQGNPAYIGAVEQVSRSYCYRMFRNDPARAKSAQLA
ncbi:MAG TPA: N-acetyltransferase [Anaerolineales bacterium]|nr:N-acetyltransferase [Anaerolineales bacterium]